MTQETFVHAWQQLGRLRDATAFSAWLRRICVNRSRNWLRTRARRPRAVLDVRDVPGIDPFDLYGAVEARTVLAPAFEALTPDQRALLALHYGLGLSIAECAEALDIRVGTAKSRLNGGLSAMRRELANPLTGADPEAVS